MASGAKADDGQRVLLVTGDPSALESLQLAFEEEGWTVSVADSSENASYVFDAGEYDLIIADSKLSPQTGLEFIATIRNSDTDVIVMMLTEPTAEPTANDRAVAGIDAYVQKPIRDALRVTARARTILKRKRRKGQRGSGVAR